MFKVGETTLKLTLLCGLIAAMGWAGWHAVSAPDLVSWMFWLIWPAMTLHQCEENVFTELVLGRQGSFTKWVRSVGYDITPTRALALNVGVGWTLAIVSGLVGRHLVYVPLFVAAVETVNGFWHLSVTSLQQRWSPGTLSSVLMTIPLGFALFYISLSQSWVHPFAALAILVLACISHHVFLASLPRVS